MAEVVAAEYRPCVSDKSAFAWSEGDEVRGFVPVFALVVAVVAAFADPGSSADLILAAIPVAAFAVWASCRPCPSSPQQWPL